MTQIITRHTARKAWRCDDCDVPIEPGQAYRRIACPPDIDVPRWSVYRTHALPADCRFEDPDDSYPGWTLEGTVFPRREIPGEYVIGPEP